MKTSTSRKIGNYALILAILVGGGWLGWSLGPDSGSGDTARGPVDVDKEVGGPFALTNTDGETVRAKDFRGQYMLLFFGYTYCPDVCPTTMLHVTEALEALEKRAPDIAEQVVPVFISVDPERDTPQRIAEYLESFHPRTVGLTGPKQKLRRTAAAYAVTFNKTEGNETREYLMDHTSNIMLMDPQGSYITHFSPRTPARRMAQTLADAVGS